MKKDRGRNTGQSLNREIGLFSATAIGIGAIVGSGIFIVTGIVAGLAGPALVFSILIAGLIAFFSALSVAELSAYLPSEGGTYAYAHELLSPFAGFISGWIWIFSNIFVGAAVALGFAHYAVQFFPNIPVKAIACVICLVFILVNTLGIRESSLVNNILVTIKIVILLFFIGFGAFFITGSHFVPVTPFGTYGVLQGAALIFFAYTGFARITIVAEEVKNPRQTVPKSIFLALGISTLIYAGTGIIAVGLAGSSALAGSGSPLTTAIQVTGSPAAGFLVSFGALVATGSVLLTTILGVSRISFAMARNSEFPSLFSRIHPTFKTPHYAIWVPGMLMILAVLTADLTLAVSVSTFAMLVYYLIANLAAIKLKETERRYPSYVPAVGALSCMGLVFFLSRESWIIGLSGIALGGLFYYGYLKFRYDPGKKSPELHG
jgi:APA family basic amino acid/polyamine antiporter